MRIERSEDIEVWQSAREKTGIGPDKEGQNCLRSEQNQTFYEFIKVSEPKCLKVQQDKQ